MTTPATITRPMIESIRVTPPGERREPPFAIDDPLRGKVIVLSHLDEPFCGYFEMKPGQIRGMAYHTEGDATFGVIEGSCISIITDINGENVKIDRVDAPAIVRTPAMQSHTFIPLSPGIIIETSPLATQPFLGPTTVRMNDKLKPLVEKIQADIAADKYGIYKTLGLPTDLK